MSPALVMIVDDEPLLRAYLADLARAEGFETVVAGDGEEALALVRERPPALVVTDLQMPRLDGRQLVRTLRKVGGMEEAPIMVVTAEHDRASKIDLLRSGADDFITKPVDGEEFRVRLKALARRYMLYDRMMEARSERDTAMDALEQRSRELENLTIGLVAALEQANAVNDGDTGKHIRRVCEYAALLARVQGCTEEFVDQVRRYAGLHDVGKVGIPDSILKKPGRLTTEEFDEMKSHTLIGGDILAASGLPRVAVHIALHHHERWDGSGYPHGLQGSSIPLEARIVSVVDVFDALVNKRCYKEAFPLDVARSEMERVAGEHLDPDLVPLFFSHLDEVQRIADRYTDSVPSARVWE